MKRKNKDVYRRILSLLSPYRHLLLLSVLLAVVSEILTLYAPVLTGRGIDLIVGQGAVDFEGLLGILAKLALVVVLTALAQWLMNLCNNKITYHVVLDIRTQAFNHLEELPLKYIDSNAYGEVISRVINDVDQFSDGLLLGFSQLFTGVITILGTLCFMLSINIQISLFVVVMTPLSLFVASFIARRTFSMFRAQSEAKARMTGLVEEMVGNQKIVQAFSHEEKAKEQFGQVNEQLRGCSLKATFFSSLTNPCTRFLNNLVYAGVAIIGAVFGIRGVISVGQISCFLSYANQYTKPFNEISGVATEFQNAVVSAGRVFDLIDEKPQEPDAQGAIVLKPEQVDGQVHLKDVAFSYTPEVPLIRGLNLKVEPGQRIAIVGPTGCGKTTLINLLMRFYDVDAGEILVSGHPIREVTRNSLRSNYGMVLQETWLKSGTIAENIAYGKPDATMQEIEDAAKAAYAHGFISRMPEGYQTNISEAGGNLSQGQKQLLCIARVMLCLPPMLILDEATSSIDTMTEVRIQKAFARMMEGRNSFIVAHRLSTIREADVILVMKDGHILEQGNHETLLKQQGFYAQLYNSQFAPTQIEEA